MSGIAIIPRQIQLLEQAAGLLQECWDLGEIKKVRDQAEALRVYSKQQKDGEAAQSTAAAIKLRAERRMGEVLKEMPKHNGDPRLHDATRLSDLGLSKSMSSRTQAIAEVPEEEFEEVIEKAINSRREVTSGEMCKRGRAHKKAEEREIVIQAAPASGGDIHEGDMSVLLNLVGDNSADLFFTDPPYHEHQTGLFGRLAELAQRKLKPGGLCLVYSGQMFLPTVLAEMSKHLDYYWLFALRHTGGHLQIWNRQVWNDWKPILVFAKRPIAKPSHEWVMDFQEGGGRDKQFHDWGQDAQEATYWIERLTLPGALVVDPFCGGGAIPAACKATGRRWIATEIDGGNAAIARNRVA